MHLGSTLRRDKTSVTEELWWGTTQMARCCEKVPRLQTKFAVSTITANQRLSATGTSNHRTGRDNNEQVAQCIAATSRDPSDTSHRIGRQPAASQWQSRTRCGGARSSWSTSCRSDSRRSSLASSTGTRGAFDRITGRWPSETDASLPCRSHQDIVSQGVLEVSDNLLYDVENRRTAFPHGPLDPRLVSTASDLSESVRRI